ncbi:MAG TPA: PIN domain-containing protein [Gemmataceae bacterium]|nr:PIN domain-containing protein [Gemmataceae bacterium]
MSRQRVLLDTGPLVAFLSEDDQHHERCAHEFAVLRPPLWTCWPVLTEAQWLLRRNTHAVEGIFRAFEVGLLSLLPLEADALPWIDAFLRRYRRLGAQLADAALVYLAERDNIPTVFTLDRRDFAVYRYGKNRSLTILPEP